MIVPIERGLAMFVDVGNALIEIRDRRLYPETHGTFENYCQGRWGFTRRRAYQLIQAAETVGQLSTTVHTPLPSTERQVRELARIPDADARARVWERSVAEFGPQVRAVDVRRIVEEPVFLDVTEAAYRVSDDGQRHDLDRIRYQRRLSDALAPLAKLASMFQPEDAAAAIDEEFFRYHVEIPLAVASEWAQRVRAEMPTGLRLVKGRRDER